MTPRREEIRKRVERATPGPWKNHGGRIFHKDTLVAETGEFGLQKHNYHRADFIAHARQDIPWLLERLAQCERALGAIGRANFAGPSTDERREWTWATAELALRNLREADPEGA